MFFMMASFLLIVTLSSLLVAQMSDCYEEVMTSIEEHDARVINKLIIDVEILKSWKRKKGFFTF
jgi:hypothetical protein